MTIRTLGDISRGLALLFRGAEFSLSVPYRIGNNLNSEVRKFMRSFACKTLTIVLSISLSGCGMLGGDNIIWTAQDAPSDNMRSSDLEVASINDPESSNTNDQESNLGLSTTGVVAATGAVIGAGIGTIIGSATGNAGEGLVLGTAAGAATGALIGTKFEEQEELIIEQREVMARQQEKIATHERKIKTLKIDVEDEYPNNRPSVLPKSVPLSNYEGNPRAQKLADDLARNDSRARLKSNTNRKISTIKEESLPPAILPSKKEAEKIKVAKKLPEQMPTVVKVLPKKELTKKEKIRKIANAPIVKPSDNRTKTLAEVANTAPKNMVKKVVDANNALGLPKQEKEKIATNIAKLSSSSKQPIKDSGSCKDATVEAERAKQASSEADKLFYFRRAARLCPANPDYRVSIGQVYASLGKTEQARVEFEKAVELDPNNEIANEELSLMDSNIGY